MKALATDIMCFKDKELAKAFGYNEEEKKWDTEKFREANLKAQQRFKPKPYQKVFSGVEDDDTSNTQKKLEIIQEIQEDGKKGGKVKGK